MRRLWFLTALALTAVPVQAQSNCAKAPSKAMRTVCLQLMDWDSKSRKLPIKPRTSVAAPGVSGAVSVLVVMPSTITDPAVCNDIPCICNWVGGTMTGNLCILPNGQIYGKGLRKEYRMMSDDERNRFHAAMWTLKNNGDYDRLAHIHANVLQAPSAHGGPSFLPWHREYVKRFEIALRLIDPSVSLPFWDTTLDGALADARYSSLWSDELMGSTMNGGVTSGAFAGWTNIDGNTIVRNLGRDSDRVLNANDRNLVLQKTRIEGVLGFTTQLSGCPYPLEWDNMEFAHGYTHVYVGGEMLVQHTAAFDPIFFLYHSYIDSLWEDWRVRRQNRYTRTVAYPQNNQLCSSIAHFSTSTMSPFAPLQNIDGCSNDYTDNLYSYDTRRPSCTLGENCGSKFLFCDRSHGVPHCASKIRVGMPCTGYIQGENMCYQSVCYRGRCTPTSNRQQRPVTASHSIGALHLPNRTAEFCFNEHECCGPWKARGECSKNSGYMRGWCQNSCNICSPRHYSTLDDCSDRYSKCRTWSAGGKCKSNPSWMSENCRKSCNRCNRSREQTCFPPNVKVTTMAPVPWPIRGKTRSLIPPPPVFTAPIRKPAPRAKGSNNQPTPKQSSRMASNTDRRKP